MTYSITYQLELQPRSPRGAFCTLPAPVSRRAFLGGELGTTGGVCGNGTGSWGSALRSERYSGV